MHKVHKYRVSRWYLGIRSSMHKRNRKRLEAFSNSLERNDSEKTTHSYMLGYIRERKVRMALEYLREQGEILDFVQTTKADLSDVLKGVDFYIVIMGGQRRELIGIQVTGVVLKKRHLIHHPEIPVIIAEENDKPRLIIDQLRQVIDKFHKGE